MQKKERMVGRAGCQMLQEEGRREDESLQLHHSLPAFTVAYNSRVEEEMAGGTTGKSKGVVFFFFFITSSAFLQGRHRCPQPGLSALI